MMSLVFSYNYNQLINNVVPPTFSFTKSLYTTALAPVQSDVIDYENQIRYQILITTFSFQDQYYETYIITATQRSTNTTIGNLSWISSYVQLPSGTTLFQTTLSKLQSVVYQRSGLFIDVAVDATVTVYYDNYTGERTIIVSPPSS